MFIPIIVPTAFKVFVKINIFISNYVPVRRNNISKFLKMILINEKKIILIIKYINNKFEQKLFSKLKKDKKVSGF